MKAARTVARNVLYSFGAQFWLLGLAFVVTPYVVRELGPDRYGLLFLLLAFIGYLAFLDFGFGVANLKFLSEFHGTDDRDAVQKLVGTSITIYLGLGLFGGAALALSSSWLVHDVLNIASGLQPLAQDCLYVAALVFLATMSLSVFFIIPSALQRMDITNRREIVFGTAALLATVVILRLGYGLLEVLVVDGLLNIAALVSLLVTSRRLLPGVSFRPRFDPHTFRLLSGFSVVKVAGQLASLTRLHGGKFLVGALTSLTSLGYYVVPLQLTERLVGVVASIGFAVFPAASDLHARGEREELVDLYLRASKLVALLVLPASSALFIFAHPILEFWIGEGFADRGTVPLQILAVAYGCQTFSNLPSVFSDALGRPGVTTGFAIANTVLNLGLAVALIPRYGITGAAVAAATATALVVPLQLVYIHRRVLGVTLAAVRRAGFARTFAAAAFSWLPMLGLRELVDGLFELVAALVLAGGLFFLLTVLLRAYDDVDRRLVSGVLGRDSR